MAVNFWFKWTQAHTIQYCCCSCSVTKSSDIQILMNSQMCFIIAAHNSEKIWPSEAVMLARMRELANTQMYGWTQTAMGLTLLADMMSWWNSCDTQMLFQHECCSNTQMLSLHIYDASIKHLIWMSFWHGMLFWHEMKRTPLVKLFYCFDLMCCFDMIHYSNMICCSNYHSNLICWSDCCPSCLNSGCSAHFLALISSLAML